jgi:hypothetical protein
MTFTPVPAKSIALHVTAATCLTDNATLARQHRRCWRAKATFVDRAQAIPASDLVPSPLPS